ncbi:MAG: DNA translocase FtsK 4TM domain-containing protein [Armatimonadota bacterium]
MHRLRREIAAIALITAAALTLASLLYSSQGGASHAGGYLPVAIAGALRLSFGVGAYAVPVVLLVVGVLFALERPHVASRRALAGAGMLFLVVLTAVSMQIPAEERFDPEWVGLNGGYIGATLAWASLGILGFAGSYIVLTGLAIMALVMLTQTSVKAMLQGAGRLLRGALLAVHGLFADVIAQLRVALGRGGRSRAGRGRQPRSTRPDRGPVVELDLGEGEPPPGEPQARPPNPGPARRPPGGSSRVPKTVGSQALLLADDDLYTPPSLSLLSDLPEEDPGEQAREEATENIIKLEDTLDSFGVTAKVVAYEQGPVITRYEVEPAPGIRVGKIVSLSDDLAMALAAVDVRVEAPIPGKSAVGIEVPNEHRAVVGLKRLLAEPAFQNHRSLLATPLGRDIAGHPVIADLALMPHLLVAGATNSGKSVCLHSIICSLLMRARPDQVKFILIDPKRVELRLYEGIPHLMSPVVYSPKEAADALRKVIREMDKRYDLFALKGVVNIDEYNELAARPKRHTDEEFEPIPHVIIVIDELADLMMQSRAEFEFSICRLAQLARATGIHLVLATQRPSVNVITGTIKANIPSRVALAVTSQHDSRTILDGQGAERLIGRGDMLYSPIDANQPRRLQGAFIPRSDLQRLVDYLCTQGEPEFEIIPQLPDDDEDDFAAELEVSDKLYAAAVEFVMGEGEASVSGLQRRFKIGYARAGRLIDAMEQRGVVGPHEGPKPRQVLLNPAALHDHLAGIVGDRTRGSRMAGQAREDEVLEPGSDDSGEEGLPDAKEPAAESA